MLVNPIPVYSVTNGKTGASKVSALPQCSSIKFAGNETAPHANTSILKRGMQKALLFLGLGGATVGLTGCPEVDPSTVPPTVTVNPPATDTATSTAITTTPTVKSELNAAWANMGIAMPTDGVPGVIEYDDFYGSHIVKTLNKEKTIGNIVVYDAVGSNGSNVTFTYTYDGKTLTENTKCPLTGQEGSHTITFDSDGYAVFTNNKTGKFDQKLRKITTGKIGIYDQSGNLLQTLDNYKNDGYLAKLESMFDRAKNGIAYETKSEGKTVKGIMHDTPELAGKIFKAASRA